jgi:hypothetical protein
MAEANTLAYYPMATIIAVIIFIVQAPKGTQLFLSKTGKEIDGRLDSNPRPGDDDAGVLQLCYHR